MGVSSNAEWNLMPAVLSEEVSVARRAAAQASPRRRVVLAAGAGLIVADPAGGAGVHPAALGQQLAQLGGVRAGPETSCPRR